MNPYEVNPSLIKQCDEAAELGFSYTRIVPVLCYWCEARGHLWKACPEYAAFVKRIARVEAIKARLWTVVILLAFGFVAGLCVKVGM